MKSGYWESIPIEYMEEWRNIFTDSKEGSDLSACCPVCHNKELHRYYQKGKMVKLPKHEGQFMAKGAEWEWCAACFRYKFNHLSPVPLNWDFELEIEAWKLMAIPEPINEKMNIKNLSGACH